MTNLSFVSRRRGWRLGTVGCWLAAAALGVVAGCGKSDSGGSASTQASGGDKPLTVGFIYVGTKDDYGYNQAHAEGAAAVKAAFPDVRVLEVEKVAETKDCEQAMESMINLSDATLIFPTSF
jgi:simple sugar transport system substrate-binding protein